MGMCGKTVVNECVGKFPALASGSSQCEGMSGKFPALASGSSQCEGMSGKFPAFDTVGTFCLQV